jgi:hypothetical protein
MRNHLGNEKNYISISAELNGYQDIDDFMYIFIKNDNSFINPNGFDGAEENKLEIRLEIIDDNYYV